MFGPSAERGRYSRMTAVARNEKCGVAQAVRACSPHPHPTGLPSRLTGPKSAPRALFSNLPLPLYVRTGGGASQLHTSIHERFAAPVEVYGAAPNIARAGRSAPQGATRSRWGYVS